MTPHEASKLDAFLRGLSAFEDIPRVFNPWKAVDPVNDHSRAAPRVRCSNLRSYLEQRIGSARLVLVAEALGYQGGHFSGVAMTSERMLIGSHADVEPHDVFTGAGPNCRTSRVDAGSALGFAEPTATTVWQAMREYGAAQEVVLWNAFAFHPMTSPAGWLTNRKPSRQELEAAAPLLTAFLDMFPGAAVVSVGKTSERLLRTLGRRTLASLRHPANGGVPAYRAGFAELYQGANQTAE